MDPILAMGFFMMKPLVTLCFLIICYATFGQKVVEKQWDMAGIDRVEVVSDSIFRIDVKSTSGDQIKVQAAIEGELYENLLLDGLNKDGVLSLKVGLTPFFEADNDKLAAHKVVSVSLLIQIPRDLTLVVSSNLADLSVEGPLEHIQAALYNGDLLLTDFSGTADLRTTHGDIEVLAYGPVMGLAKSKKGEVDNRLPEQGTLPIRAKSVNGAIRLNHSHQ